MWIKKLIKPVLCLSLSLAMAVSIARPTFSVTDEEGNDLSTTYISEVKVFSGNSTEEAKKQCEDAGYIATDKNLNSTSNGDNKSKGIYILGYKTTTNPDEGITGISMQQMNHEYQDYSYATIAQSMMNQLGDIPDQLQDAVYEFKKNYAKKSPAAIVAYNILNCYYIDEMNNIGLGDYLVSGNCTVDFLKKIMTQSSTTMLSTIYNALVAGTADNGSDKWATRISSKDIQTQFEDSEEHELTSEDYSLLDKKYKTYAKELTESLENFASSYHDAYARYTKNNNKLAETSVSSKDEDVMPDSLAEDVANSEEIETNDGDGYFLYAYNLLNTYQYDENTKLGDYFLSLGDSTYEDTESLRKIYPLVASLTDGQFAVMRLCGVATTAIYLVNEEKMVDDSEDKLAPVKSEIQENTGKTSLSIWTGTEQIAYSENVAVTKEAYRANNAGQIYNTLTAPDVVDEWISKAMSIVNVAGAAIAIGYGITFLSVQVVMYVGGLTSMSVWAVCCAGIGSGIFSTFFGVLGCAFVILNYIGMIALLVVLVAMFIKWIYDLFQGEDDDEEYEEIPTAIFDEDSNQFVRYDTIKDASGNAANINGDNAKRWNVLYYTKSKTVGSPICSNSIDDLIQIQYDNISTPTGYSPVTNFGEVTAANLNANCKNEKRSIYMYVKSTENEINEGEEEGEGEEETSSKTKYLASLSLSVESTETAAKAALTKSGYYVLDQNLSPDSSLRGSNKKYTYLGFKTTTNKNEALTDIRISARDSSSVYCYGGAQYTSCGTSAVGDTLYYTAYKCAGSPILADFLIKNSLDDIPSGYEPINLFSGGNAYNMNTGSDLNPLIGGTEMASSSQRYWENDGTYVYFKPSATYTSGEEYISGFVLVAGNTAEKKENGKTTKVDTASDYIKALHLKKLSTISITHGVVTKMITGESIAGFKGDKIYSNVEGVETYICYTTTHNPYRAIYGVKSYTSSPGNNTVSTFLGSESSGYYAAATTYFELPEVMRTDKYNESNITYYQRGVLNSHSYAYVNAGGSDTGIQYESSPKAAPSYEDYEETSWKNTTLSRGKGLYVLGPGKGGTPLTVDDIKVSSSDKIPDGYASVQDFKTPNRTKAHNIGYHTTNSEYIASGMKLTPAYIYVKQDQPVEKKYISSIKVSSYSIEKVYSEASKLTSAQEDAVNLSCNEYCMQTLISSCSDEIILANVANYSDSIYQKASGSTSDVSYIGVTRTDNASEAITGLLRYVTNSDDVSDTITVDGISYKKAGDKIKDPQGSYYLYYTYSSAATPGQAITSIDISDDLYKSKCATALSTKTVDVSKDDTVTPYGDTNSSSYIHTAYEDKKDYMGTLYVGHGKTEKEAKADLLALGCSICVDLNVNKDTDGEYVYIGYSKYSLTSTEKKKGIAKYAIRDIVATVGEDPKTSISINGVTYRRATDDYMKNKDDNQGVSLNSGNNGSQIYIYYSIDYSKLSDLEPIQYLGVATKDYAIVNDETNKWEYVLDTNSNHLNTNDKALKIKDHHLIDNRIYFYVSRYNKYVKKNAEVDQSSLKRKHQAYNVYIGGE